MTVTSRDNDPQQSVSGGATRRRRRWAPAIAIVAAARAALVLGVLLAIGDGHLPDLPAFLGGGSPSQPDDALHVDDVATDPKGFQGTIHVRGVMAFVPQKYPGTFAMIDTREARMCRELHCAKKTLSVKTTAPLPEPWDELHVRGKIVAGESLVYLEADSIENLGSIK
ncbi:MAG: hypothetical protein HYV63_34600 [Candidatus Schekmanbacteria bacterium]|nr:hypothetical protein [Candidatus Schekmanbacteria bacterium]